MEFTQEQLDKMSSELVSEIALQLYEKYANRPDGQLVFYSMPKALRDLAEAFEESAEEDANDQ
jgi:hypothetical protein